MTFGQVLSCVMTLGQMTLIQMTFRKMLSMTKTLDYLVVGVPLALVVLEQVATLSTAVAGSRVLHLKMIFDLT